jgi:glycosyltransferase involved in cell wall biosynthesis
VSDARVPAPRSVLVVEDQAHVARGHMPVRFAELAAGFAALGHHVEVLTSRGWYFAARGAPFRVHRYGAIARSLARLCDKLLFVPMPAPARGWVRRGAFMLRVVVMVGATRARRARMPPGTNVVIVSDANFPALLAAIAGPGRWLKYVFYPPRKSSTPIGRRSAALVQRAASRAERARRARGGRCIIAVPAEARRREWVSTLPGLEVVVLPVAGVGDARVIPDARGQLGIAGTERLALLFGAIYSSKDPDVVFRAFEEHADGALAGWALMAVGTVAGGAPPSLCALTRPGFVDDHVRALAYNAADLVVISFFSGFLANSGTLMDAITWGVPVVCSDGCAPADVVREFNLGTIFEPGDAASLADAVRAAPSHLDPGDIARVRAALSNRAVAQRMLDALEHERFAV